MKLCIEKKDAVYAFIQARFNSVRLRGKVLKLLLGKTILERCVERAGRIHSNVKVVVITGGHFYNEAVINLCKNKKISFFCGSEDDVLNRFNEAAAYYKAKTVIRLTADNPLLDFNSALVLLSAHLLRKADYSSSKPEFGSGFPEGIGIEIFDAGILSRMDSLKLSRQQREHVNEYILKNRKKFNCILLGLGRDFSGFSFTIDTESDFKRISGWMKKISPAMVNRPDYYRNVIFGLKKQRNHEN